MEAEIEHRILVVRPETLSDVKEARAHGDLSENFEYKAAKKAQRENEGRIRYLKKMIKTAVVIPEDSAYDEVGLNDKVTVYYPEDDIQETIRIVTTIRSNSLQKKISIDSPLGKALLKHKVNDAVRVKVNDDCFYDVIIKDIVKLEDNGEDELRKY
jgi:transcription elongation factor GreA